MEEKKNTTHRLSELYRIQKNTYERKSLSERLPLDAGGSSPITVFRPMLEMSRSCSLSDSMFVHNVSTIVSTWYSFTLLTSGPKLGYKITIIFTTAYKQAFNKLKGLWPYLFSSDRFFCAQQYLIPSLTPCRRRIQVKKASKAQ